MLRIPKTYLGLALAVVIAVMSVGLFLLMGHTEGKIPMTSPAGGTFIAPEGLTSTGATTGGELTAATVAPSSTTEPSSASTDADLTPAPGAPLIGATATGPDRPPVVGLDAKPLAIGFGLPGSLERSISAAGDIFTPAIESAAAAITAAISRAEPLGSVPNASVFLERGDALFGVGDVSSARLFYERAADAGDGQAALRLGETYDPTFLERAKLRAVQGDAAAAIFWYRRARELGVAEAEILLRGIQTK